MPSTTIRSAYGSSDLIGPPGDRVAAESGDEFGELGHHRQPLRVARGVGHPGRRGGQPGPRLILVPEQPVMEPRDTAAQALGVVWSAVETVDGREPHGVADLAGQDPALRHHQHRGVLTAGPPASFGGLPGQQFSSRRSDRRPGPAWLARARDTRRAGDAGAGPR